MNSKRVQDIGKILGYVPKRLNEAYERDQTEIVKMDIKIGG